MRNEIPETIRLFDDDATGKYMLFDIVGTRVQNHALLLYHELLKLM